MRLTIIICMIFVCSCAQDLVEAPASDGLYPKDQKSRFFDVNESYIHYVDLNREICNNWINKPYAGNKLFIDYANYINNSSIFVSNKIYDLEGWASSYIKDHENIDDSGITNPSEVFSNYCGFLGIGQSEEPIIVGLNPELEGDASIRGFWRLSMFVRREATQFCACSNYLEDQ